MGRRFALLVGLVLVLGVAAATLQAAVHPPKLQYQILTRAVNDRFNLVKTAVGGF